MMHPHQPDLTSATPAGSPDDPNDTPLEAIEAALAEIEQLKARLLSQEARLNRLRLAGALDPADQPTVAPAAPDPGTSIGVGPGTSAGAGGGVTRPGLASRRAVLGRAGAAVAALGLAGAAGAATTHAEPPPPTATPTATPTGPANVAGRATGASLLIGQFNSPTSPSNTTWLTLPSGATTPATALFWVENAVGAVSLPPGVAASIVGTADSTPSSGNLLVGLYGRGSLGVAAAGLWPLQLVPRAGLPATADSAGNAAPEGALYYESSAKDLWYYPGSGQSWRRFASADQVGVLHGITPTRILDTRGTPFGPIGFDGATGTAIAAGPFTDGQIRTFRVGGKAFGSFTFPTDTTGILGNVTLVDTGVTGGFVTVYPGGTAPNASTVNPSGAPPYVVANFTFVALSSSSSGNVSVRNVGGTRDILIDVVGYYL